MVATIKVEVTGCVDATALVDIAGNVELPVADIFRGPDVVGNRSLVVPALLTCAVHHVSALEPNKVAHEGVDQVWHCLEGVHTLHVLPIGILEAFGNRFPMLRP